MRVGSFGEQLAEKYLKQKGYKIIARNFRIRGGELDIVALDGQTTVYIEVKTRTNNKFGAPEESVGKRKLNFLIRASQFFRNQNPGLPESERIDVIAVQISGEKAKIKHIKNASF